MASKLQHAKSGARSRNNSDTLHRNLWEMAGLILLLCATATFSTAQTFTTLYSFAGTAANDGSLPGYGALVQGFDGNLYGTTVQGGINCSEGAAGCGEVFKITPGGVLTGIHEFCAAGSCPDGNQPEGGLALNIDGSLYGMTQFGGTSGSGTVFKITPGAPLDTLYSFDGTIGAEPMSTLVRAGNGNFYGITQTGGITGSGAIVKVTPRGIVSLVHSLSNTVGIGQSDPAALAQGTDGNFYGVTGVGGSFGVGTVFRLTPGGMLTVLHNFSGTPDGAAPSGTLVQGTDGDFYGTTRQGGANGRGTVFKITPAGELNIVYSFCPLNGCPDGFDPVGGLVQAADKNFYGTTLGGGSGSRNGTVFQMTPAGKLKTLHSFTGLEGSEPLAGLVQHTSGIFYGTTNAGGANDMGSIFSLSMGKSLNPFVELVTTIGKVGASVVILGDGLTGTSEVSFGGASAAFQVVSDTEITTTVPGGATTDVVTVTTPTGTLTSNKNFAVTPQITGFNPNSGGVGTLVTIDGVSLTQTSSVKFRGKPAAFTVNSDTQVTATVPAGAVSGKIMVTTPGGRANSATAFTVTP